MNARYYMLFYFYAVQPVSAKEAQAIARIGRVISVRIIPVRSPEEVDALGVWDWLQKQPFWDRSYPQLFTSDIVDTHKDVYRFWEPNREFVVMNPCPMQTETADI